MSGGKIPTIKDLELKDKNVLLRLDFNVPLADGKITDDTRIRETLPTIRYCLEQGARLTICSHLGRPDGRVNKKYSLEPVAEHLAELIGVEVVLSDEIVGDGVHQMTRHRRAGDIVLLENLRFEAGEEANDPEFCRQLARLADVYINDAFGAAHRKHASTYGIASLVPERAVGFLIEKELQFLDQLVRSPKHPFVVVAGGAKVTDKLKALENLLNYVDELVIGGAMAYAFLAAQAKEIGKSKCEKEGVEAAKQILTKAAARKVKVWLPVDHVVAYPNTDAEFLHPQIIDSAIVPADAAALDIGPKTVAAYAAVVKRAQTIFWNGPMGFFEKELYSAGTKAMGEAISTNTGALRVAGGGDTLSAVAHFAQESGFDLLSTGGGASLNYLEGRGLPGIEILRSK